MAVQGEKGGGGLVSAGPGVTGGSPRVGPPRPARSSMAQGRSPPSGAHGAGFFFSRVSNSSCRFSLRCLDGPRTLELCRSPGGPAQQCCHCSRSLRKWGGGRWNSIPSGNWLDPLTPRLWGHVRQDVPVAPERPRHGERHSPPPPLGGWLCWRTSPATSKL